MDKKKIKYSILGSMVISIVSSAVITILLMSMTLVGTYIISPQFFYNFIESYHSNRLIMDAYMIGCVVIFFIILLWILNFLVNRIIDKMEFEIRQLKNTGL